MKLQCSCGAKYSFEVTPDMVNGPVHFSCPSCGMDYSEFVTNLVRQELSSKPAAAIAPPPPGYIAPPPPGYIPSTPANVAPPPAPATPKAPVLAPIGSVRVPAADPAPAAAVARAPEAGHVAGEANGKPSGGS